MPQSSGSNKTQSFQAVSGFDLSAQPKGVDFAEIESKLKNAWQDEKIFHYVENDGGSEGGSSEGDTREVFAVDTPPPTVSGSLHVGHIFSYTQTDMLARFQRMKGKNVFYPMGWDDNGLPTERRVQNFFHVRCEANAPYQPGLELPPISETYTPKQLKEKRIPQQDLSRKNFIEHCHRLTIEDEKRFKDTWQSVGLSVDWNLEYATIHDRSQTISQMSFLDLYEKGHLYQVEAPTLWDTDFQTAVAQAELEDREMPGAFHHIQFGVEDDASASFTIATTRPELLPACVGVTYHPSDKRYQHLKGKNAVTPLFGVKVPVFESETVDPEKGTGILMVCTFGDQTDVQWWREQKLPLRQTVGRNGLVQEFSFEGISVNPAVATENYEKFKGRNLKQAQKIVVEMLQAEDTFTGRVPMPDAPKPLMHAVKFYEKGDRPVEILTTRQWFVRLTDKKEQLIEYGSKVKWHPEYMFTRFKNWTENLSIDWCVSRQRFFGVSIPVWYPVNSDGTVLRDQPMLPKAEQLPIDPMSDVPAGFEESQRGQPGGFVGESDVFDTWFTSSMTPQLASGWSLTPERHKKIFPMDVRPQAHEIIRTWAFYTIAKSMLHEQSVPWKNIVISGWVLDPNREKMSKSKGNVVTPADYIQEYGADAVRYWAGLARYGVDTTFDLGVMKVGRRLAMKLFNAGKFVLSQSAETGEITEPLDLAFLEKLKVLVAKANQSFSAYEGATVLMETERFFWSHFTDSYLELVKGRTWGDKATPEEKQAKASAVHTLRLGLKIFLKLFAPFLPFITDEVWRMAFTDEAKSVHVASFPSESDFNGIASGKVESYDAVMTAQTAINQKKTQSQVSIARPVIKLVLKAHPDTLAALKSVEVDLCSATKTEKLETLSAPELEVGVIEVNSIEYGADAKKEG